MGDLNFLRLAPFEDKHLLILFNYVLDLDLRDFKFSGLALTVLLLLNAENFLEVIYILFGVQL
jgi:hypothetical protein